MRKIVAVIQARVGSKRLPRKVLLDLEDRTVLEHVIYRVKNSKLISDSIVATTILKEDLEIMKLCSSNNIRVYCGSENDVLDRYYQAARLLEADDVVRITADCPLIDTKVIDRVLKLHLFKKTDYTSNAVKETFPDGEDVEVFTFKTLQKAWKDARMLSEREHVTSYMKKHPELFKIANLKNTKNLSEKRWTLDEREDYKFIKLVYEKLYKKNKLFGMEEIIRLLNEHPEYEKINNKIRRNEGYLKSLKKDKTWVSHKIYI